MTQIVFQKAIKCLQKEPSSRRPDELAQVQQVLLPLAFFSKMMKENYQKQLAMCIRSMKYRLYKKGETVFHRGDKPNSFYIVLTGEIQVLSPKEPELMQHLIEEHTDVRKRYNHLLHQVCERKKKFVEIMQLTHRQRLQILYGKNPEQDYRAMEKELIMRDLAISRTKSHEANSPTPQGRISILAQPFFPSYSEQNVEYDIPILELHNKLMFSEMDVPELYFKDGVFAFDIVNTLLQGSAFGEGGLILHQGRSASVICTQDCDLAIVENKDYKLILQDLQFEKMMTKTLLICQSLGDRLDFNQVAPLMTCFQKVKIKINNYLFKEDQLSKHIFIIKKGEVLCSKNQAIPSVSKSNKLQQVQHKTQHLPLALIRTGTMLGYSKAKFSAQTVSSFTSLYQANRAQIELVLNDHPHLIAAFEMQSEEFDKNLFFRKMGTDHIDRDVEKQQIRIDIQDIKQSFERRGKKTYGNQITEICENRKILNNRLFPHQEKLSADQMLLQFDSKAQDKAEKIQRQRSILIKRLKLLNPNVVFNTVKELTVEQKIRTKRLQKIHDPGIFQSTRKQIINLSKLLGDNPKRLSSAQPDAISINNIQKFLDQPSQMGSARQHSTSQNFQNLSTFQFYQQGHSSRPSTSSWTQRPVNQFRTNSQHNLFRSRNRKDVEQNILSKRKFSILN